MSDSKTSVDKTSFIFGLVAGIAVISVAVLLNQNFKSDAQGSKVAGEVVAVNNNQPTEQVDDNQPAAAASIKPVSDGDYVLGDRNAKVAIIEYSDFECPYCLRHQETIQRIADEYGDKVAIVFRHFPLTSIHPQAQKAAEASECAGEQGKFWEMHDAIFADNAAGEMSVAKWKEEAKSLGLNTSQFDSCLDGGKYATKITQDINEGSAAGVQGTPATFVNGTLVSGAVPYEQFKSAIDQMLQ